MRTVLVALAFVTGCALKGDEVPAEAVREVPPFTVIEVFDEFEVEVTVRPELDPEAPVRLRVAGEANALHRLFTEVHGDGSLSIAVDPNVMTRLTRTPRVTLEVPALRGVFASDGAAVQVTGASGALAIEAEARGVVEAAGLVEVSAVVIARDAAEVRLAGAGPELVIHVADAASVDASALSAEAADVTVAGSKATATVCTTSAPTIDGEAAQVTRACSP